MEKGIISIKQKWIDKIFSGEKIFEVRKSKLNKNPIKFYIYSTKNDGYGKIVGEMIIDYIFNAEYNFMIKGYGTGCTEEELKEYSKGKNIYYWHIKKYKQYKKYKDIKKYSNIIPNSYIIL